MTEAVSASERMRESNRCDFNTKERTRRSQALTKLSGRNRLIGRFVHWRTWWDVAAVTFAVALFPVLLDISAPAVVVRTAFSLSILLFLVGFACLAWRQRGESE